MAVSNTTPLNYFDTLLESNNLKFRKDTAINEIIERYGGLVKSVDYKKGEVDYIAVFSDGSPEPIEAMATYSFANEFTAEVIKKAEETKQSIDSTVLEINKNGNNANQFLISQIKHLSILADKSKNIYPKLTFIEDAIRNTITYLVDRYSLKESYKKTKISVTPKSSFFDIKSGVKMSLLEQLYDVAVDLEIIDDEMVTEEIFINVLTGNPTASNEVLIFKCNNRIATHFINCINSLFNNLTASRIEKSKSLIGKNGNAFTQQGMDNINSFLKHNTSSKIERITSYISRVLNS